MVGDQLPERRFFRMARYAMVINLDKCIGCNTCAVACKVENHTGPDVFWCSVEYKEVGIYPLVSLQFLPRSCAHCANPPCVEVCPTGASFQRQDGIVLINYDKCIGCKYCIIACPYGSRYYNKEIKGYFGVELTPYEKLGYKQHQKGAVEKCNFCIHRVEKGEVPACVEACPVEARYFGDLDDPSSAVSRLLVSKHAFQLLPEVGASPNLYYLRG